MKQILLSVLLFCSVFTGVIARQSRGLTLSVDIQNVPVLALKDMNEVAALQVGNPDGMPAVIEAVTVDLSSETGLKDLSRIYLLKDGKIIAERKVPFRGKRKTIRIKCSVPIGKEGGSLTVGLQTRNEIDLDNKIRILSVRLDTDRGSVTADCAASPALRTAVALRQRNQDGVDNCRIPGLAITPKGTILAVYDARRERDRDLQGDIDICYNRSTDGGRTWSEMKVAMDMGEWGGLPEKFNGVSDPCILVDSRTGDIYVAACWMHGVIDEKTGKWVEGLTEESENWNHQWRRNGSLPGYGVRESSQWVVVKSTDDGLTWSQPENFTRSVKPESFCLTINAPGAGITLKDGTLVFPGQGRWEDGFPFSTLLYSKDGGKTWTSGTPAIPDKSIPSNECMVAELPDGSLMLNMRSSTNRRKHEENGRLVSITRDLGKTWETHPTSGHILTEPACQGSLLSHLYKDSSGKEIPVLLFFNPNDTDKRIHHTLRCSLDGGMTWPDELSLELDEGLGNGYSCLISIDGKTVGVLYEGSGACLVYQQVRLDEILDRPSRPKFNAHRGLQPFGPENSIASFEAAAEHGVWAIETDFRMTADSEVVCIHDAKLDRTTDGKGLVRDKTLAEVRGFRVMPVNTKTVRRSYDYAALTDRQRMIPTMDEYFEICRKGDCVAFVELKEDGGVIDRMNEAIRRHRMTGWCVISSSNRSLLKAYRDSGGKELIHLIFGKIEDLDLLLELGNAAIAFNYPDLSTEIHLEHHGQKIDSLKELVDYCHSLGLKICFRAVDTQEDLERSLALGIDYLPTNNLW